MTIADGKTGNQHPHGDVPGFTPETLNACFELQKATEAESQWPMSEYRVSTHHGRDASWVVVRRPDIYGDGSPAGQVGQEVYGAGNAFILASRAYFRCGGAPFRLFADYPVNIEPRDDCIVIKLRGAKACQARIRLIALDDRAGAPKVSISGLEATGCGDTYVEYRPDADAEITMHWS